jgi:ribosomal protein S14
MKQAKQAEQQRNHCDLCGRPGQLVCQTVENSGPRRPWVWRYYLCRWHRAAYRDLDGKRVGRPVIPYVPDSELLDEWHEKRGETKQQSSALDKSNAGDHKGVTV